MYVSFLTNLLNFVQKLDHNIPNPGKRPMETHLAKKFDCNKDQLLLMMRLSFHNNNH